MMIDGLDPTEPYVKKKSTGRKPTDWDDLTGHSIHQLIYWVRIEKSKLDIAARKNRGLQSGTRAQLGRVKPTWDRACRNILDPLVKTDFPDVSKQEDCMRHYAEQLWHIIKLMVGNKPIMTWDEYAEKSVIHEAREISEIRNRKNVYPKN
ncbi:hypothetical protein [Aquisediminimonas sediminicola]|uniref:hypothetical protein n=1 Tax=Alteraquisediminimonas sediminicola TaxID=2676787 RepID=UPI001C8D547B|nr:hypothetical protein [Aquisediminimonas sediminicola]